MISILLVTIHGNSVQRGFFTSIGVYYVLISIFVTLP